MTKTEYEAARAKYRATYDAAYEAARGATDRTAFDAAMAEAGMEFTAAERAYGKATK